MKVERYAEFIRECRKRGFQDVAIKASLLEKGWPVQEIDNAFHYVNMKDEEKEQKYKRQSFGSSITIFLDDELRKMLVKRAKKNMLNLPDQIEDILRRSTLGQKGKKSIYDPKIDDKLVSIFSRKKTGPKEIKKKKKVKKTKLERKEEKKREKEKKKKKKELKKKK